MQPDKLYMLIDEILKGLNNKEDKRSLLSDSEIIFIYISACYNFSGNYSKALDFLSFTKLIKYKLSKSRFSRRLKKLKSIILIIFNIISEIGKTEADYFHMDSFPVRVCHNIRIGRCKIVKGEIYRGYNSSKREYYFGYKVQLITSNDGYAVEVKFLPCSFHDTEAFEVMDFNLPDESELFTDSGYTAYYMEDILAEEQKIKLMTMRKKNSKMPDNNLSSNYIKQTKRHAVETHISSIVKLFPNKIHAINSDGFLLKIFGFILSYNFYLLLK